MEDVVGLIYRFESSETRSFMTWGRVFDPVDPTLLIQVVMNSATAGRTEKIVEARVCRSLQEVSGAEYFFESLFYFANERIPYGRRYDKWANSQRKLMEQGKSIYDLGRWGEPLSR